MVAVASGGTRPSGDRRRRRTPRWRTTPAVGSDGAWPVRGFSEEVERVLDVLGRERLDVVPLHVAPEQEDRLAIALLPRPSFGKLPDDRVDAVGRLHWIEEHQIVEARHGRPRRGDRRALVDREALR